MGLKDVSRWTLGIGRRITWKGVGWIYVVQGMVCYENLDFP